MVFKNANHNYERWLRQQQIISHGVACLVVDNKLCILQLPLIINHKISVNLTTTVTQEMKFQIK